MDDQATDVPQREEMPKLPLGQKLLYSSGYFGVSVLNGLFLVWVLDFYKMRLTDPKVQAGIGIALMLSRVIDAVSDPLVGYWSDRTRSRWGRRRPWIAAGALPLVLAFTFVWFPPVAPESLGNLWWLLFMSVCYFTLFSVVVNPYLAMLPDIARTKDDRVATSSLQGLFGLSGEAGTMVGGSILAQSIGIGPTSILVAGVAAVSLVLPLFVREPTAAQDDAVPTFGLVAAVKETLSNRPFRVFLLSKWMFWLAVRSVLGLFPFYVVAVLGVPEDQRHEQVGFLLAWGIAVSVVFFGLMKYLARRFSQRKLALAGLLSLAVAAGLLAFVGLVPAGSLWQARGLLVLAGFPIAVVFAIPNAILADIVDLDERTTGKRREAMYYGAQGFFVKISWGVATAIVMVSRLASQISPALGERLCCVVIGLVCLGAFAIFLRFPEDKVLQKMQDARRLHPAEEK